MELIYLDKLSSKKNLLAFSSGTDSCALFDLLVKEGIEFDIAMVDYNVRDQSKEEVAHAKSLAKTLNKDIFILEVNLEGESNFEKRARDVRYDFFDSIMKDYDNLILGHNLSDKTEWFLMQLTRGSGIRELFGMQAISVRKGYSIVRPLLECSKSEIAEYLENHNIKHFFDESNLDQKYERNYFRAEFSEKLLENNTEGIKKTFKILEKEIDMLPRGELIFEKNEYCQWKVPHEGATNLLSKLFKERGYLLSGPQREEFERVDEITVIYNGQKISATYFNDCLFLSPLLETSVSKKERDNMRKLGIPPKHRAYYYENILIKKD